MKEIISYENQCTKGEKNLTSEFNLNCNKCASTKSHARTRPDACTCISRCIICIYLVCLVLAGTVAHRNGLKKSSKLK